MSKKWFRVGGVFALLTLLAASGTFVAGKALAPTPREAAETLYDNEYVDIEELSSEAFNEAFPTLDLYLVKENIRHPPIHHRMVWNPTTDTAYDFTKEFDSVLAISGAVIATAEAAVTYGKAFAESANVELEQIRQLLSSEDSSWLGISVDNPTAVLNGTALQTSLSTWAESQGILAEWTIQFNLNSIQFAKWQIAEAGVGPGFFDVHGHNGLSGFLVYNAWNTGTHARAIYNETGSMLGDWYSDSSLPSNQAANRTNHDGSWWNVTYPAFYPWQSGDPVLQDGDALARGGVHSYATWVHRNNNSDAALCYNQPNPAPNMGLESMDRDCKLLIKLSGGLTPFFSHDRVATINLPESGTNTEIMVTGFYKAYLNNHPLYRLYLNASRHTNVTIAEAIITHEHHHVLQYAVAGEQPLWDAWFEGQAVVVTAVGSPGPEYDSTSMFTYWVNQYQAQPDLSLCRAAYMAGPFWAVVYAKNGGYSAFNQTLNNMTLRTNGPRYNGGSYSSIDACEDWMPQNITAALAHLRRSNPNTAHANFTDAFRDLLLASYSRDLALPTTNGTFNWGPFMKPVKNATYEVSWNNTVSVDPLATKFLRLNTVEAFNLTLTDPAPSHWGPVLFQRCPDGTVVKTLVPVGPRTAFQSRSCVGTENMLAVPNVFKDPDSLKVHLTA